MHGYERFSPDLSGTILDLPPHRAGEIMGPLAPALPPVARPAEMLVKLVFRNLVHHGHGVPGGG